MERSCEEEDTLTRSTKKLKDHHVLSSPPTGDSRNSGSSLGSYKEKLMGVIPGAFEQAFGLQSIMQEEELSDVEDKTAPEGWVNVSFSKEEKVRMRAPWSSAIIVKTYGRNVGFSYLSSRICSL